MLTEPMNRRSIRLNCARMTKEESIMLVNIIMETRRIMRAEGKILTVLRKRQQNSLCVLNPA